MSARLHPPVRSGRRRGGFTLFEILGAVTILAIVYSWLAASAMQGMRSEGLSKRRLEASLIADEALAEVELGLVAGITPAVERTEREVDDLFTVVTEVVPFDPTPFLGEEFPPEGATTTLLLPPEQPQDAFLRIVQLRVVWTEGDGEHEVKRTTLAYDTAKVAELFPENDPDAEDGAEDGDDEDARRDQFVNPDGSPNVDALLDAIGGGAQDQ